ncbi:guanine nucleotide-binding protein G(s) subunit alpha isoforms XLas [Drosophila tropicalis]|uniref:guanine nucleotide-binding protein G(s) subunit alpha isoforms XLas n=1 Tax=Drosophila tropicalis TaxID=46794 RepID=UPI0035AB6DF9
MAHQIISCSLSLLILLVIGITAEPARFRSRSSRFQLARQEAAADPAQDLAPTAAPAPYPPAGVTPEVPFDLPTETEAQPDLTYGPPDNTYGPPAVEPDNTYGPPPAAAAEPDNIYGPPATNDATNDAPIDAPIDDGSSVSPAAAEAIPASLIQPRNGRLRNRRPVPEKLRSAQIIRAKPILVYTI